MSLDPADSDPILAQQMRDLLRFRSALDHELRSGLNSIALNVALLSYQIGHLEPEPADTGLQETIAGLHEGVADLTRRIAMVLRMALPTGEDGAALDLAALLRDLSVFVTFEARLLGVRCETDLPPDPIVIEGPRSLVHAALLGLAAHALRVAMPGGSLHLSVQTDQEGAVIELAVRPFRELSGEAERGQAGLAAMAAGLQGSFEAVTEGEVLRLRMRLPTSGD